MQARIDGRQQPSTRMGEPGRTVEREGRHQPSARMGREPRRTAERGGWTHGGARAVVEGCEAAARVGEGRRRGLQCGGEGRRGDVGAGRGDVGGGRCMRGEGTNERRPRVGGDGRMNEYSDDEKKVTLRIFLVVEKR